MQIFIKKMITERDELKGRISKVKKAIENPPYGSDAKSIELLKAQVKPMEEYLAVLEERIAYADK